MKAEGVSEGLRRAFLDDIRGDLRSVAEAQDPELARSVSRKIWETAAAPPVRSRLHIRQVLQTSIATNTYVVWPVAVIWVLSAWGPLSLAIGWPRAVAQMVFTAHMPVVDFPHRPIPHRALPPARVGQSSCSSLLLNVVVSGPVASLIFDPRPLQTSLNLIVTNSLWLPFVILLVTVVAGAVRASEQVIEQLTASVDDEEIRALAAVSEEERIRRDVASQLHGNVQARLLASAALMRQPALMRQLGIEDPAEVLLDIDDFTNPQSPARDFREQLGDVVRPWNALMQITVEIEVEDISPDLAESACRIIEEGLSNAYRHGGANTVDVSITKEGAGLRLLVQDDGSGPPSGSEPGLGSAVLDSLAGNSWSLTRSEEDRTVLEVLLGNSQT
jgi:hypothetical protein